MDHFFSSLSLLSSSFPSASSSVLFYFFLLHLFIVPFLLFLGFVLFQVIFSASLTLSSVSFSPSSSSLSCNTSSSLTNVSFLSSSFFLALFFYGFRLCPFYPYSLLPFFSLVSFIDLYFSYSSFLAYSSIFLVNIFISVLFLYVSGYQTRGQGYLVGLLAIRTLLYFKAKAVCSFRYQMGGQK